MCWSAGLCATHCGELVKHTGDGLMAAFRRAGNTVAAALIQRLILRRNEGSEVALGVRVRIRAGDVRERAGDL
jgi:class 3 adenylate cyclase